MTLTAHNAFYNCSVMIILCSRARSTWYAEDYEDPDDAK